MSDHDAATGMGGSGDGSSWDDDSRDDDLDDEGGFDDDDDDDESDGVRLRVDDVDDPITHLLRGEIEVEGRMPHSSNATFLVHVHHDGASHPAIYKPVRGERPLWDFEPGLHRREVATYRLSEALGIGVVPPTVLRDGPLGEGSVQWYAVADHAQHYFTIYEAMPELHDRLRDIAALDILANNTDRKSGHCLLVPGSGAQPAQVWGIDHGLCFAPQFKLRTVIWEFGDEPIPEHVLAGANRFVEAVPLDVAALLSDVEVEAVQGRAAWMVKERRFPVDDSGRRYPWPLV
ncbi:SCO1664 family protein [Ilumatobacter sp.]|uniref:SCO1664 family protein n=1 Tax=Ilumatobacter sp. TaxID=1967498 RepID=UPI003B521779